MSASPKGNGNGRNPKSPKPGQSGTSGSSALPAPGHVLAEVKTLPPQVPSTSRGSRGGRGGRSGGARAQDKTAKPPKEPKEPPKKRRLRVQDLWGTADYKRGYEPASAVDPDDVETEEDEAQEDDEDMAVVDTFADYKPAKLKIGKNHPDPVIETSSMASVLPPNISYNLHLPERIIESGRLSALQLESITYACQQHEFDLQSGVRSGYLIGDGAGVGKGRTIAGIIYENWLQKRRKSLWISVSADLKFDTERDLNDVGASMIKVHPLNKVKYGKISQFHDGVIFATYSALIGTTKSSSAGRYNTRLKQLVKWCGNDFDGPIIFDECHRAKNLCPVGMKKPTKTGKAVEEIQKLLPRARIVYASATGASEPKNMAYMTRLGIWGEGTPFKDFSIFLKAIETRGVGAMEVVAMDMKLRGAYIARQLSFKGVTFNIEKVPLGAEEVKVYDESVELWVEALKQLHEALVILPPKPRQMMSIWAQFWGAHQRFFKYLCIASKVKRAVEIAKVAVKEDKCVVIGLQSTGEARTLEQLERDDGELNDFVSTAKGVLQTLVEKQFPGRIPMKPSADGLLGKAGKSLMDLLSDEDDQNDENKGPTKRHRQRTRATKKSSKKAKLEDWEKDSTDDEEDGTDFEVDEDSDHSDSDGNGSSDGSQGSGLTLADSDIDSWYGGDSENEDLFGLGLGRYLGSKKKKTTKGRGRGSKKPKGIILKPTKADKKRVDEMKAKLLEKIEAFGTRLPQNSLDQLIHELGGPNIVAEMTGRKGRVVHDSRGNVIYETRAENDVSLETVNLKEKDRFMKGQKLIAIISEAASSGISLQSDRRSQNQRRRVHITLELPWSADRAIQQFGRTHRSNQVNAPEYIFLISDLAGEHRFASIVAKRLESLGALTHGDRRATESRDLSQFHIDNKYGRKALDSIFHGILDLRPPLVPLPKDFEGDFRKDMAKALSGVELVMKLESPDSYTTDDDLFILAQDRSHKNMSKFLNRILGIPVRLQNSLFQYFVDSLDAEVKDAKKKGIYDAGILDLNSNGTNDILRVRRDTYQRRHATGIGLIELHELKVERGLSWEQAMQKYSELNGLASEGFYVAKQAKNGKTPAILAISNSDASTNVYSPFTVYRPNTGMQWTRVPLWELRDKNTKVTPEQAKQSWEYQYKSSETVCRHAYWSGNCKIKLITKACDNGLRQRTYHVLSGSVLLVWAIVEKIIQEHSYAHNTPKMQTIRVKLGQDDRIVGVLIPNYCAQPLRDELAKGAVSTHSQGIGALDEDNEDYLLDFGDVRHDVPSSLSMHNAKTPSLKDEMKVKKEKETTFKSSQEDKADYMLNFDVRHDVPASLIYNAPTLPLQNWQEDFTEEKLEKENVFPFANIKKVNREEDEETEAAFSFGSNRKKMTKEEEEAETDTELDDLPAPAPGEDNIKTEPLSLVFKFDPFAGLLD